MDSTSPLTVELYKRVFLLKELSRSDEKRLYTLSCPSFCTRVSWCNLMDGFQWNFILGIFQYISNKMQRYIVYFNWKLLYMFRVVSFPIIRSANNCIYSTWYLSHRYCYMPLSWKSWNGFECAVGGVSHDGRWYLPKYVGQFPDKINCVRLHLVGYILE